MFLIIPKLNYKITHLKVIRIILLIFVTSLPLFKASAQDFDTRAKMKAVYIYNFATYTQWPVASKKGNFVIGILGNYPAIVDMFKQIAQTNKVGLQTIMIKNYNSVPEIENCHILFIIREMSNQLPVVLTRLKGKNTLLITDNKGLGNKGAGISFFTEANRQKFELNKVNIEKYGLKVSSKLLNLADVLY